MRSWRNCCCLVPISINFVGMHAWTGLEGGFEAVRVTEWQEPQAVIGSYLQKYALPRLLQTPCGKEHNRELINWQRGNAV